MERITEDQIARLVAFVYARISDAASLQGEARRAVAALRLVADKQVAAVRYLRASRSENAAVVEHANSSWNLLVSVARIWRDHSDFPVDAVVETFEFDADNPLMPTG
ncbi:hypothetical protein [Streptomyces sp. I5]|uniref:hypothetical protein n=1 Tax=Streptomyces sp. I5 TaxID=2759947 RepID=UPI0018EE5862|nr:hypothetical protein [Streptomyces sp. I5]MBJ6632799.1 hypothetical protein [Streptomyces sp. I5]